MRVVPQTDRPLPWSVPPQMLSLPYKEKNNNKANHKLRNVATKLLGTRADGHAGSVKSQGHRVACKGRPRSPTYVHKSRITWRKSRLINTLSRRNARAFLSHGLHINGSGDQHVTHSTDDEGDESLAYSFSDIDDDSLAYSDDAIDGSVVMDGVDTIEVLQWV